MAFRRGDDERKAKDVEPVRVLVVDDQEPYWRAMSAAVAETDGFNVMGCAPLGEESVAAFRGSRPVLMDVRTSA